MSGSGDAAEQVVRLSLEGMEVAARISGVGAKNVALLIASVLKEEKKTAGKSRLTSLIKSGHELKVFSMQQQDLVKFAKEAKRYGVLYSVLREKGNKDPTAEIDVIARAADAPKIGRIMERFKLSSVDKAAVISELEAELNPTHAKTEKDPRSLQNSSQSKPNIKGEPDKPSVRETLSKYRKEMDSGKAYAPSRNVVRRPAKRIRSVKERELS